MTYPDGEHREIEVERVNIHPGFLIGYTECRSVDTDKSWFINISVVDLNEKSYQRQRYIPASTICPVSCNEGIILIHDEEDIVAFSLTGKELWRNDCLAISRIGSIGCGLFHIGNEIVDVYTGCKVTEPIGENMIARTHPSRPGVVIYTKVD